MYNVSSETSFSDCLKFGFRFKLSAGLILIPTENLNLKLNLNSVPVLSIFAFRFLKILFNLNFALIENQSI